MRKYVTILVMLLCVGFVSCSDDSNDVPAFKIAGNETDITAVGGTVTVTLSMEGEKATSDQSWCVPSISGKVVELTLEKNVALEGRTALITVTKGEESISFPVTQPGNFIPTIKVDAVEFDAHGGELEVPVRNGLPFSAVLEDGVSWLQASVSGSTLVLVAEKNYTRNKLATTVKLVSEGLESEFVVQQSGLVLTPEKSSVVMYNKGDEVKIMVNSTLAFTAVSSDEEWLTVTTNDDSVTLKAEDNSGNSQRTATVTLTSEGLTAIINVTQRPPIYTDYLGNWTLTGYDNGAEFTYNLSITQATAGLTYKLSGWGKSVVATDSEFAIEANFDANTGLIYITAQTNIGVFTDTDGSEYDIMFYGRVEMGGSVYFVGGSGYICYIGQLGPDGSVQWGNGQVDIGQEPMPVVGANYFGVASDGTYTFRGDDPFMRKPKMTKAGMTRSARSSMIRPEGNFATRIETNKQIFK